MTHLALADVGRDDRQRCRRISAVLQVDRPAQLVELTVRERLNALHFIMGFDGVPGARGNASDFRRDPGAANA